MKTAFMVACFAFGMMLYEMADALDRQHKQARLEWERLLGRMTWMQ